MVRPPGIFGAALLGTSAPSSPTPAAPPSTGSARPPPNGTPRCRADRASRHGHRPVPRPAASDIRPPSAAPIRRRPRGPGPMPPGRWRPPVPAGLLPSAQVHPEDRRARCSSADGSGAFPRTPSARKRSVSRQAPEPPDRPRSPVRNRPRPRCPSVSPFGRAVLLPVCVAPLTAARARGTGSRFSRRAPCPGSGCRAGPAPPSPRDACPAPRSPAPCSCRASSAAPPRAHP